jgi:hypothetical protein
MFVAEIAIPIPAAIDADAAAFDGDFLARNVFDFHITAQREAVSNSLADRLTQRMMINHPPCEFTRGALQVSKYMGCARRHPRPHFTNRDMHFYSLAPEPVPMNIDGGEIEHDVRIHHSRKYFALRLNGHPIDTPQADPKVPFPTVAAKRPRCADSHLL